MSDERIAFLLAFDRGYCRMARALINSLVHFHEDPDIRVYTMEPDVAYLREWAGSYPGVCVEPFMNPRAYQYGEWHPLIWAKLEAFAATDVDYCVVLDVDQIMYGDVSAMVARARAADKYIAASPDMTRLHGHMHARRSEHPTLAGLPDAPCFNAGAMIIRPDMAVYRDIQCAARDYHHYMFLPEQGILNVWSYLNQGSHDLGERFMLQPMSPQVLAPEIDSCLVHFWTPRPQFFGSSPGRQGEPTWLEFARAFERDTGHRYPTERFQADFERRLAGYAPMESGP